VPDEEWYQDADFDRVLADAYGIVGVIAMEKDGTVLYSWNADAPFITASTYKIFLMATCFRLREEGELDFWEEVYLDPVYFEGEAEWLYSSGQVGAMMSISEAIYWMATQSSNIAARSLIARVGGDEINETIEELGLEHTRFLTMPEDLPVWPPPVSSDSTDEVTGAAVAFVEQEAADGPVNVTTPRDMARFFYLMLNEELISPEASWELHDILADQQVGNERFPELVPGAVVHKTGDLPTVHNDVGIIWGDLGPVILVSLFNDMSDKDHAAAVDRRLALLASGGELDWEDEAVRVAEAEEARIYGNAAAGDGSSGGVYDGADEDEDG
jgi:beta-lactamase class A